MSASGGRGAAVTSLHELQDKGLAQNIKGTLWVLTERGYDQARKLRANLGRQS